MLHVMALFVALEGFTVPVRVRGVPAVAVVGTFVMPVTGIWGCDTTTVRVTSVDPTGFVTVIVKVNDPAVVGVPDNKPAAERDNPSGKSAGLADHVGAGEPMA